MTAYREAGYLPESLINYLSRLGWSYGDQEIFSLDELVEKFTLDNVVKSPAVFNPEKLLWLNGWWIRHKPAREIAETVLPVLRKKGFCTEIDNRLLSIIDMTRERAKTLHDITGSIDYFFNDEMVYEDKARKKFLNEGTLPVLQSLIEKLENLDGFDRDSIRAVYDEITESMGIKLVKVAQPTRVALTGGTVSPPIFEVMEVLGKETVLGRLKRALPLCV